MTRTELLGFMREHWLATQASVSASGDPQAAVVGFVVTDAFELFFDTLTTSRKAANLRQHPRAAFVIGGAAPGDERTVQLEGVCDEPAGDDLRRLKELYFVRFPDGRDRERSPAITYFRVRPAWIRYSDFSSAPPAIIEYDFPGAST